MNCYCRYRFICSTLYQNKNQITIRTFFISIISISAVALLSTGCTGSEKTDASVEENKYVDVENLVDTIHVSRATFQREMVTNGKLHASRKSDLTFAVGGNLKRLLTSNGSSVEAGQVIGTLDQVYAQQKLEEAEINLKKQKIKFDDILLQRAKGPGKVDTTSLEYLNLFVTSGYQDALKALEAAKNDLQNTVLRSPFRGKIANLVAKEHEQISSGKVFCTVIDDSKFEVEFFLIESEITQVSLGEKVAIIPFSLKKEYYGAISEINPVVNENGQVMVKGLVNNTGTLWEGMNTEVIIRKSILNKFVVPKSSIVTRQDQNVLFSYSQGKAFWTYVKILAENSTSYAIEPDLEKAATLSDGDAIIISGNLNLAHQSDVRIK